MKKRNVIHQLLRGHEMHLKKGAHPRKIKSERQPRIFETSNAFFAS
jgi:hypothetical protein